MTFNSKIIFACAFNCHAKTRNEIGKSKLKYEMTMNQNKKRAAHAARFELEMYSRNYERLFAAPRTVARPIET